MSKSKQSLKMNKVSQLLGWLREREREVMMMTMMVFAECNVVLRTGSARPKHECNFLFRYGGNQ